MTTVVSELEQPPSEEIQDSESPPDSPILESMIDVDVYLQRRTSPRREKSPPPPPPPAEPAPAPGNEKDKPEKWCLHCGTTWTLQWRTGPAGESTLCNACGVRYRQGRLVPEYRPRASPTFNQSEHAYKHHEVLKIRKKQDHPAPPAAYKLFRTRKRRKGKGQQQPAQIRKKRKRSNDQNQPAQAQPAAVPVLRHAGDEMEQHLPPPPPELPQAADDRDTMAQHLPPPPAQPHAGGELIMDDEPLPPPDPFLFDGPAAPRIIDDDEPWVIVIDDD
jgi:hypothetical protein